MSSPSHCKQNSCTVLIVFRFCPTTCLKNMIYDIVENCPKKTGLQLSIRQERRGGNISRPMSARTANHPTTTTLLHTPQWLRAHRYPHPSQQKRQHKHLTDHCAATATITDHRYGSSISSMSNNVRNASICGLVARKKSFMPSKLNSKSSLVGTS